MVLLPNETCPPPVVLENAQRPQGNLPATAQAEPASQGHHAPTSQAGGKAHRTVISRSPVFRPGPRSRPGTHNRPGGRPTVR